MTYKEIRDMIAGVGIPSVYHHFDENTGQEPPFICFLFPGDDDFKADNSNYVGINQMVVELYTNEVDFELEDRVENVLAANDFVWSRGQEYLDDEKMYITTFTTEVIIDGEQN